MFCPNCGKKVSDIASVCIGCGRLLPKSNNNNTPVSAGWWWLGFLVPIAGFIIWGAYTSTEPQKAKKAGFGAIAGLITSVVLTVLFYILYSRTT
jgi:hypothetical protein